MLKTWWFLAGALYAHASIADQTVTVGPGMAFNPPNITIAPGETVTWSFVAPFHTTTSNATTGPDSWNSEIVPVGGTFSHTFTTVGSHPYYCFVHSSPTGTSMNGVVNVVAPVPTIDTISPTNGPVAGGTPVRITGTNFDASCSVRFGASNAVMIATTATTIDVTSPPHAAGAVDVTVTCSGGSVIRTSGFTYIAAAAPSITSFTPPSGPPGIVVAINGANFQPGATVTFGGTAAAATFVSSARVDVTVPSIPPGSVVVTVTNPDAQSASASFMVLSAGAIPLFSARELALLIIVLAAVAVVRLR